jgi:hypothetical protein
MAELTQGLELPNGLKPENYPQSFVQSPMWPKRVSSAGKEAPTLDEVMRDFTRYPA